MATKTINVRVDEKLKNQAESLLSEMGLTMSGALNLFLQQMVNKRALPFTIEAADPFYSQAKQALLEKGLLSIKKESLQRKI